MLLKIYCDASISSKRKCRIGWYAELEGHIVSTHAIAVPVRANHGCSYLLEVYAIADALRGAYELVSGTNGRNISKVCIHTDCKSVVDVVNGIGRPTQGAEDLYSTVKALTSKFTVPCVVVWLSRNDKKQSRAHNISGGFERSDAPNAPISATVHYAKKAALSASIAERARVRKP